MTCIHITFKFLNYVGISTSKNFYLNVLGLLQEFLKDFVRGRVGLRTVQKGLVQEIWINTV